jgi:hypothetical protein
MRIGASSDSRIACAAFLFSLLGATEARSQAAPMRLTVAASPGVGSVGPSLVGALALNHPRGDLVLRLVGMNEWGGGGGAHTERWRDLALLYGYRDEQGDRGWFTMAAGPAMVFGVRAGSSRVTCDDTFCGYADESFRELSLGAQLDLVWIATDHLGLGVNMFGNVNGTAPFGGGGVSLHLGPMR